MSLLTGCLPSWGESPGIELQSHIACVLQHVIPAPGRRRQKGQVFRVIHSYTVSSNPP